MRSGSNHPRPAVPAMMSQPSPTDPTAPGKHPAGADAPRNPRPIPAADHGLQPRVGGPAGHSHGGRAAGQGPPSGGAAGPGAYAAEDVHHSPMLVFYEVTRACDLVCQHCRACAQPAAHPNELDTAASRALLEQFTRFPKPPMVVFTGGDPFKREDVFDLVAYARQLGLTVAMTPSATPLVTSERLARLRDAGIHRLAVSLDGADAATHDAFRGVGGSFDRTLWIMAEARRLGLPQQVNTTITRFNAKQVDAMAELIAGYDITLWSVFFLVPVGRGLHEQRISAEEYEQVFEKLWQQSRRQRYGIKTTEAHHYRRFVLQRQGDPQAGPATAAGHPAGNDAGAAHAHRNQRAPLGISDGKGVFFVSHTGSIYPSGFMPITCGRFPADDVVSVYQDSPLLRQLRDPDQFHGKCGVCDYRFICGGSRARAYALTRDPLASEPDCIYMPPAWVAKLESVSC